MDIPELQNDDSDKTVEELLDELGPEDTWTIGTTEEEEITNLLESAQKKLRDGPDRTRDSEEESGQDPGFPQNAQQRLNEQSARMPDIDLAAFQPEADSDPDDLSEKRHQSKAQLSQSLDKEAKG